MRETKKHTGLGQDGAKQGSGLIQSVKIHLSWRIRKLRLAPSTMRNVNVDQ